jgi:cytochrome b involved in lipid metabolism
MKKIFILILFISFSLILTGCKEIGTQEEDSNITPTVVENTDIPEQNNNTTSVTISLSEVQSNNNKSSCWTIIDKKVYDITQYIPLHPGGDEILEACGKDGSILFKTKGTDNKPHSQSAVNMLNRYLIGDLE